MTTKEWISIKKLPDKFMKVRYKMVDGNEDIGCFQNGEFYTFDPISIAKIIQWKPLNPSQALDISKQ